MTKWRKTLLSVFVYVSVTKWVLALSGVLVCDKVCEMLRESMRRKWTVRETKTHVLCVCLWAREWNICPEVCVCPGTCEVVCGRREGKLIKPMITLMRSQGVKPETAFHFLSHFIPLSPASIHPSLLYSHDYTFLLFLNRNSKLSPSGYLEFFSTGIWEICCFESDRWCLCSVFCAHVLVYEL